jgi:hypothetical protein
MALSEADTRAKLIDPALHTRGWHEDLIRRERLVGPAFGEPKKRGFCDYVLCFEPPAGKSALAFAVLEAKSEDEQPALGLDQARDYAKRLQIKFAFATNGHLFTEHDFLTGLTTAPRPLNEFPSPAELRARYEAALKIDLASGPGRALFEPYRGGEGNRRYYQDAAIRAAIEKIAAGGTRVLLALATGAGKTFLVCEHPLRRPPLGVNKGNPFTRDRFDDFFAKLPTRPTSDRSWTMTIEEIKSANYSIKAANPNAADTSDRRTAEELLAVIQRAQQDIDRGVAALKAGVGVGTRALAPANRSRRSARRTQTDLFVPDADDGQ